MPIGRCWTRTPFVDENILLQTQNTPQNTESTLDSLRLLIEGTDVGNSPSIYSNGVRGMRGFAKTCRGSLIRPFTTRIGWSIIARAATGQGGVDISCGGRRFNHHHRQRQTSTVGCALIVMFQKRQTGERLCQEAMRISTLSRRLSKEEISWAMAHKRNHNGSNVQTNSTRIELLWIT